MSEERDKNSEGGDDRKNFPQPPPFSFYRIYFIIALIFIALYLFTSRTTVRETDWSRFEQNMLQQGDVERVVVVNNEVVEVFINKDSLKKEQYEDVASTTFGQPNEGPHYFFTIGSVDDLREGETGAWMQWGGSFRL
jgi:AFG3 family protein